ncbi:response regulator transcription factor [Streptomyces sp900105245]|uniref:Sensory transduction protein RegX3 n=1 Tax=Streptomyces sp. 900105245 TaxID=3154379 RepID=A0ABV1UEL8_9ACTN
MTRVLIVDDDAGHRDGLSQLMSAEGYEVVTAVNGHDALYQYNYAGSDLILLDWALRGTNGIDVFLELRRTSHVPIIVVSSKDHEADKVLALEMGADDYVTKPFFGRELVARIRAVLRGYREKCQPVPRALEAGPIRMDIDRHRVTVNGQDIHLPLKEFDLLHMLLRNSGRILTRQQLLDRVWGVDYAEGVRALQCHIRRLRLKIEPAPGDPRHIVTIRGVGYRYQY